MPDPWAFGWDQIAAFGNTAAIIFAAWIAKRSVQEWRQERLEARQTEVAEHALSLAYQAPEVFGRIRSVGGFTSEGSSRKPEADETPEEKQARDQDFVPIERIANEGRFFEQIAEIRPRVDALFGKGQSAPFTQLLRVRGEIILAARVLHNIRRRSTNFRTQEQEEEHFGQIDKYESIVWQQSNNDEMCELIENAVAEVERLAAPLLESRLRRKG